MVLCGKLALKTSAIKLNENKKGLSIIPESAPLTALELIGCGTDYPNVVQLLSGGAG